ncbi:MAG: zinc ribbon domain-containing protein [Candidatus Binatia bacterium]
MDTPVETSIDRLAALQEIDRQLREKTESVQASQEEVAELENQLLRQRDATRAAQAERELVNARRRELEGQLEAEETRMKDRRMRLNRVRNEKELQALRHEIEVGKEANQRAEEELLQVLESLDALNASVAEAERGLAELEAASNTQITEQRARMGKLLAEVAREREGRERMADGLDANLRREYERIFERRGGTAVVAVRDGTCQGCHVHLPPQLFNELQRTREVRLCPNCHRILFWRPEHLEPTHPPR